MQHSSGAHASARDNDKARRFAISLSVLNAQASYHLSISLPTQPQAH